jgi:N-acetylglucosaminyl-diphospho-decaprenol L-rhamnosyltransferase
LQLSIIIVNYNVKYFLEQCLCSVIKAVKNIDAEILVVDNNSADGSKEFFSGRFPQAKFLWKNENTGFAKANNEALQSATGDKILFLNPDTIVPEDCFEKCLAFFSTAPHIGALGVRMIDGNGNYLPESKRGFPSFFTSFCKISGLTKLFPHSKLFADYYLAHLPENEINEADVLSGAFIMADKKALDKTGGFDEIFFMYAEDIDLSYRIKKAGFKNYYFPQTTILHFKGESTRKDSVEYVRNFYGAMLLFIKKHYRTVQGILYAALLNIVIWFKGTLLAFKNKFTKNTAMPEKEWLTKKVFVISETETFNKLQQDIEQYFAHTQRANAIDENIPAGSVIVFCEPELSFNEIIAQMQLHRQKYEFFIHAKGTRSITGSNDKSTAGNFIIIEGNPEK